MLMPSRALAVWGLLLLSSAVYGQGVPLEKSVSDFHSEGIGLTEILLKFSHQEHFPIAIEYVDRASLDNPIKVSLRNTTIRRGLNAILLHELICFVGHCAWQRPATRGTSVRRKHEQADAKFHWLPRLCV